jgi:glycosyltransferase involved in cell wall biosynthesis
LNKNIHYVVVGGWLPTFLSDRRKLVNHIASFIGVYVQTKSMVELLEKQGIHNSIYMPNCKKMEPITSDELVIEFSEPYNVCTFSRIIAEKGIKEAVEAIEKVNETLGRKCYCLDIYGDIESQFEDEFRYIISKSSNCIKYLGAVNFNESKIVLKEYFALLFPTYYDGEGFPGTFIDAFSAGLPVIASDWMYNNEIICDGETGYIYKLRENKADGLIEILMKIAEKPDAIIEMRKRCLLEAEKYKPQKALAGLLSRLEEQGNE